MPPTPTKVTAADRAMASALNVPAQSIATLRSTELEAGHHWTADPAVQFTPDGESALRAKLGLPEPAPTATPETPEPVAVPLKVINRMPNKTYVRVKTPEGTAYPLRVRNSTRLKPGTVLRCVAVDGGWRCVHPGHEPKK